MLVEEFARYAMQERHSNLRPSVVHHTKRAVIDWFAAFLPGSIIAPATLLEEALAEDLDRGRALLASGGRATLRTAAMINGTASHTVEFDDVYRDAGFHPGSPIISAALAAAQVHGATGEDFMRAVIVGYEISTRIGEAVMPSHYRYWHTTGTVGAFGAAAAVAMLAGCDRSQFAHALATVGTFASGLQQAFRSEANSKPFHSGHAAEVGALAAITARHGVTGALDLLEGPAGFGAAMSEDADWSRATNDLGRDYRIERITFKNHGCCGHNFAPIDGALHLQARYGFKAEEVNAVHVATYKAGTDIVDNADPVGEYQAKFSLQYVLAHALVHGSVRLSAFTPERMRDPLVRALLPKIRVSSDPEMSRHYPTQRAALIDIDTVGGSYRHKQETRKGDPDMPLSDTELEHKYIELAAPVIGDDQARTLLAMLWSLERAPNVEFDFSTKNATIARRQHMA